VSFFGAATFGAGRVGPGFQFTANNSYLAAADGPQWTFGSNAFTIELWANFWTTNGSRALVAHDQGGGAQNKWIFWMDGGQLRFHINGTLGNVNIGSGAFTPFSNVWYHLAVTRDFSNYTFFVNGSAIATNVDSRAIPDASASLTIGQAEGNFYFHGLLDEIGIYNRALSAAEISSIYAAGTAGKCRTRTGVGLPYFTDFESGVGAGWSEARWETSQPAFFTRFSGRFDNVYQTLTLTNLTPGQSHTLLFDFYPIDSWDGNSGGDFFYVGADGVQLLRDTFANFNGNPPSSSQSFPRNPDEGRAHFGFEGSFVDAIYRGIRLAFVPSNDFAILAFAGQGLQPISDESWGIDNVRVQTTADAANTIVHSSTLPLENTTNIFALDGFVIAASRPLLASTANNAANYSLREAGGNGLLGDGDDIFVALTPSFTSGQSVTLAVNNAPLQPGRYRFATTAGLQDTNGNAVTVFTREFVIEHPVLGRIENTSNATIPTATPLPTTESPSGSGLFTAFAAGAFSAANDVDYWRFDAEAGDRLTVRLETEVAGVNPQIIL
jgi:hypothetical protein